VVLDVETIILGEGQWWQIHTVVSRGMRKKLRKAVLGSLPTALSLG
jgi:hypothetical protein